MSRYLMTHSLLSSWLYSMKGNSYEDSTTERNPREEFLAVLRREPTPTTEAMQNGIDFEDTVNALALHQPPTARNADKWYDAAFKIAQYVEGGVSQYRAKKTIQVQGLSILLYGRLDWLKAGNIIDIKFSKGYERGKYVDSTQHPVYMELVPEATVFTYKISNGVEVWTETYRRDETPSIYPIISDFLDWLQAQGLMEVYKEHWLAL